MALLLGRLTSVMSWLYRHTVTGLKDDDKADSLAAATAVTCDASHATDVYFVQATLAPSSSVTINLSNLVESQFGQQLASTRAYAVEMTFSGAAWSFAPGPSNAITWFLSGTLSGTPVAGTKDQFSFGSGTPATIDSTHKMVAITNLSGSATLTYSLAILLGQGP